MKVGDELHKIGFQILPILTDGHKTNARFFKELSGGNLSSCIENPFKINSKLFLLFDPVHLMKNYFNNFERHR
jgi:hypothetical protein